jgi:ABC-2 type transport system permease protein
MNQHATTSLVQSPPSISQIFRALMRADIVSLWHQRQGILMTLSTPIIILFLWDKAGTDPFVALALAIAIGLPATGLLGYPQSLARDRERYVLERLRATPIPTWTIMFSRIIMQLIVVLVMSSVTMIAAMLVYHLQISGIGIAMTLLAALVGGATFLALGQMTVSLLTSPDAVNAAGRALYFPMILLTAIGQSGLGNVLKQFARWNPVGAVETVLKATLKQTAWGSAEWISLLILLVCAVVFTSIGTRWFRWSNR